MLHDFDGCTESVRSWELFLHLDAQRKILSAIPIYNYAPLPVNGVSFDAFHTDTVLNFAVYRKAALLTDLRWDERIKINGEHEDFFLSLKQKTARKAAFLPSLQALHCPSASNAHYHSKLRSRQDGWRYLMQKWGIEQILEIVPSAAEVPGARASFFGTRPTVGMSGTRIVDQLDAPAQIQRSGIERMRLRLTDLPVRHAAAERGDSLLGWLETPAQSLSAGNFEQLTLSLKYKPHVPMGSDLIIWSRADCACDEPASLELRCRWHSDSGTTLEWMSAALIHADLSGRWWEPQRLRVPSWPAGSKYLIFELWAAGEGYFRPVALGFVFCDGPPALVDLDCSPLYTGIELAHDAADGALRLAPGTATQLDGLIGIDLSATSSLVLAPGSAPGESLGWKRSFSPYSPPVVVLPAALPVLEDAWLDV
jgi:hypothetical protein